MRTIIEITKSVNSLPEWFIIACFFFYMWVITLLLLIRKDFPVKIGKKQRKVYDWIYIPWCYIGGILGSLFLMI